MLDLPPPAVKRVADIADTVEAVCILLSAASSRPDLTMSGRGMARVLEGVARELWAVVEQHNAGKRPAD